MNINNRFHQLAVKEALGTITHAESEKLGRYQALRREKPDANERRAEAERQYLFTQGLKFLKQLQHE